MRVSLPAKEMIPKIKQAATAPHAKKKLLKDEEKIGWQKKLHHVAKAKVVF